MKKIICILFIIFLISGCTSCQLKNDDLEKLKWPDHRLVNMLPKPKSSVGEVQDNSKDHVKILVGKTKRKDYIDYIEKCKNAGFDLMKSKEEDICNMNHKEGYSLSITYNEEDQTMIITIKEKTYKVKIHAEIIKNLLFNRYDVNLYLDDKKLGMMEHGKDNSFEVELKKGKHTLRAEKEDDSKIKGSISFDVGGKSEIRYEILCNRSQIQIRPSQDEEETEEIQEESMQSIEMKEESMDSTEQTDVITAENNEQFASILSLKNPGDPSIEAFVNEHMGNTIKFNGNIAFVSKHEEHDTGFDYLIYSGDYNENSVLGPNFQIENLNHEELPISEEDRQKHLKAGVNIQITAELAGYDPGLQIIKIVPISIIIR